MAAADEAQNMHDDTETIACKECDLLMTLQRVESGHRASCPRCTFVITRHFKNAQDRVLAYSTSALIFLFFSIPFSFLSFNTQGKDRVITLIQSMQSLASLDYLSIALLIFLTTILIPALFLSGVIYVLLSIKKQKRLPYTPQILKIIFSLLHWNMAEIFLIGILVSLIKIASLAEVSMGLSFWSFLLFILCLAASISLFDQHQVWSSLKNHD